MMKVTIVVLVLALVYCTEAKPNVFDMFNLDPHKMQADIRKQIKEMTDPSYLKNQDHDGIVAFSSAMLKDGIPAYEIYLAEKKDGEFFDFRNKGPQ